ncbi:ABC transporter permease [Zhihengliuella salsuginis]|uniref:ABC-2 type transport system permease protein n=1 Tax=Zhihengliuella salsuginis TaxID=578222 RepID=A0ABQ3GKN6_9MICC|nr:ABC transporter permease [Zhihengliuella salsuginis]GHD11473.1 hypothetical protein GCM10008096_26140 [Zhihengliuella salsuginis]
MTATAETPLRNRDRGRGVVHPSSFVRVLRAETIKFFTIPSPVVLMICSVVLMIGIGALAALASGSMAAMMAENPDMGGEMPAMSAVSALFGGVGFVQLIVGSLGVIVGSSEFSTGLARTTFTAVPRRLNVLGAKIVVLAVAAAVVTLVGTALSAVAIWPIAENYSMSFDVWDPQTLQGLWTTMAYLVCVTLIGLALGMLLRNAAGGIVILAALLFVLPLALNMIGHDITTTLAMYLPDAAYTAISGVGPSAAEAEAMGLPAPLEVWQGWLALGAWAALPTIAAGAVLHRRDI